jgi:membrane associated rhomboid family serine protease
MADEPTAVGPQELTAPRCYRHADRETYIRCQRCDRPICPDCMRQAAVGFQCPECVREGAKSVRQPRTAFGGRAAGVAGGDALVTRVLIGINAAVFLLLLVTGGQRSDLLAQLWLSPTTLCASNGAGGCGTLLPGVADGAVWQLVTSYFTHVQLWHIGFNMLALYVLGPQLEGLLGRARFLALYLLAGLFGSLAVYVLSPVNQPTVGASGAIFGLMGALLVVAVKLRSNVQALLGLLAVNAVITVVGAGYISWQGHLGGFVGGVLLGIVLVYAPKRGRTLWQVAGLAVALAVIVVGVVLRTLALS